MIKTILFDTDGMVIRREMYFSQRFSQEFNIPLGMVLPFFKNEFRLCLIGKADLKQELAKYFDQWNWQKSADDLILFWFEHESNLDQKILESVRTLREKGFRCYLDTNNEKYRIQYLLENFGLKNHFDGLFTSVDLGFTKPQPEFWSAIHDQLSQPDKSEVLVWDDGQENVESAKEFGFQSELYSGFDAYQSRVNSLFG